MDTSTTLVPGTAAPALRTAPTAGWRSAAGNRRKDGNLLVVCDRSCPLRRFAVDPDPAVGQDPGEVRPEFADRGIEQITDGCCRRMPLLRSRRLPGLGEKTESGHELRVAGGRRWPTVAGRSMGSTATCCRHNRRIIFDLRLP